EPFEWTDVGICVENVAVRRELKTLRSIAHDGSINQRVRRNMSSLGSAPGDILKNGFYSVLQGVGDVGEDFCLMFEGGSQCLFIRCPHVFGEHFLGEGPVGLDSLDGHYGPAHELYRHRAIFFQETARGAMSGEQVRDFELL